MAENGSIYNQNHKSHSSAQPAAVSSPSLYRGGTRDALNRLLFEGFLRKGGGVAGPGPGPGPVCSAPLQNSEMDGKPFLCSQPVEGERRPGEKGAKLCGTIDWPY